MAIAAPELVPPKTMVRPAVSIHSRALLAAMSALFWWSAVMSSMGWPSTLPPKSSMAIWIAIAPFLPSTSEYRLDMSVIRPILTWAAAPVAKPAAASDRQSVVRERCMAVSSGGGRKSGSDAQQLIEHGHLLLEFCGGEVLDHAAVLHHVETVR